MKETELTIYWHNNLYLNTEDMRLIVWFYQGSDTLGKKYRLGYREGDNSSMAIYQEVV